MSNKITTTRAHRVFKKIGTHKSEQPNGDIYNVNTYEYRGYTFEVQNTGCHDWDDKRLYFSLVTNPSCHMYSYNATMYQSKHIMADMIDREIHRVEVEKRYAEELNQRYTEMLTENHPNAFEETIRTRFLKVVDFSKGHYKCKPMTGRHIRIENITVYFNTKATENPFIAEIHYESNLNQVVTN